MVVVVCALGLEKWACLIENVWPLSLSLPWKSELALCGFMTKLAYLFWHGCCLLIKRAWGCLGMMAWRGMIWPVCVGGGYNVSIGHPYPWAVASLKSLPSHCDHSHLLGHMTPSWFAAFPYSPSLQHVTWPVHRWLVTCWACDPPWIFLKMKILWSGLNSFSWYTFHLCNPKSTAYKTAPSNTMGEKNL